MNLFCYYYR